MERNVIRRVYDRFFGDKTQPDMQRPIRCVKTSEVDELIKVGNKYLTMGESNRLRGLLNKLKSNVWDEMKKKDEALLRDSQGKQTGLDELKRMMEKEAKYNLAYGGRRARSERLPFNGEDQPRGAFDSRRIYTITPPEF